MIETAREALADLEDFLLAPSERRYEQRPAHNLRPRERAGWPWMPSQKCSTIST